jgi:hypothetical protein
VPAARGAARRARAAARRLAPAPRVDQDAELAFSLVLGLHHRDDELLRSIAHPALELTLRSPHGDRLHLGAPAHRALADLGEALFARRHVGEWWGASGGSGAWWTSSAGKPLRTIFFSALGGDATRADVALAVELRDGLIGRVTVVTPGSLAGRPI